MRRERQAIRSASGLCPIRPDLQYGPCELSPCNIGQAARISDGTFASAVTKAAERGKFSWNDGDVLAAMERVTVPVLFYHGAKDTWLSPDNSRFLQADPLGLGASDLTNPQSLNLYGYVQNDPVNFVDPSGLNAEYGGGACFALVNWTLWDNGSITINSVSYFCVGGGGSGSGGGSSSGSGDSTGRASGQGSNNKSQKTKDSLSEKCKENINKVLKANGLSSLEEITKNTKFIKATQNTSVWGKTPSQAGIDSGDDDYNNTKFSTLLSPDPKIRKLDGLADIKNNTIYLNTNPHCTPRKF